MQHDVRMMPHFQFQAQIPQVAPQADVRGTCPYVESQEVEFSVLESSGHKVCIKECENF